MRTWRGGHRIRHRHQIPILPGYGVTQPPPPPPPYPGVVEKAGDGGATMEVVVGSSSCLREMVLRWWEWCEGLTRRREEWKTVVGGDGGGEIGFDCEIDGLVVEEPNGGRLRWVWWRR
ncbi:hypothetical protein Droror1_Dr00006853 [Drosera rotundifolia]